MQWACAGTPAFEGRRDGQAGAGDDAPRDDGGQAAAAVTPVKRLAENGLRSAAITSVSLSGRSAGNTAWNRAGCRYGSVPVLPLHLV